MLAARQGGIFSSRQFSIPFMVPAYSEEEDSLPKTGKMQIETLRSNM